VKRKNFITALSDAGLNTRKHPLRECYPRHARPSISAHKILTLEGSDIAEATSDMDFSRESSRSLLYSV